MVIYFLKKLFECDMFYWFPLKFGNIDISKMLDPRLLGKIYFQQACFYFEEGEKNEL